MRKSGFMAGCLLLAATMFGQSNDAANSVGAKQGDNIISAYYGLSLAPFTLKKAVQLAYRNHSEKPEQFSVSSFNPIGLTYELMVKDRIGLGAELGYGNTSLTYHLKNTDQSGIIYRYNYVWTLSVTRVQVRANIHLSGSGQADAYLFVGGGLRATRLRLATDDPNLPVSVGLGGTSLGVKMGFGYRYFFTENFGLYGEVAIGTPIICGGLSVKF